MTPRTTLPVLSILRPLTALPLVVAGIAALLPGAASACTCFEGVRYSAPAAGDRGVPTNAQVRVAYTFTSDPALHIEDGAGGIVPTDLTIEPFGEMSLATLTLADGARLAPQRSYEIRGDITSIPFTTGSGPDTTPPTLGGISRFQGHFDDGCSDGICDTCGPSVTMLLGYEGAQDDQTPEGALLFEVFVEEGDAAPTLDSPSVILSRGTALGWSLCLTTWPGLRAGDVLTVRARAIDGAGNVSALSAPVTAEVEGDPDSPGPGCATSGAQALPGAALAFLMGLVGLGRRRRPVGP